MLESLKNIKNKMQRFLKVFQHKNFNIIGMVHVNALPGTPNYLDNNGYSWKEAIEKAKYEANIYAKYRLDSILIENMHDIPYVQDKQLGPEIIACMTRVSSDVRQMLPESMPCGIQILACGNKQAIAVAKAANLQYIRAEGFVFGHLADEGYVDACAGTLLRYRKQIDADNILVFTDLKKKHSSHAITMDVNLLETAKAAEFFQSDGIIITGNSTGHAASPHDLNDLSNGKIATPIIIGSGVTCDNVENYFSQAHAAIIGSHFKIGGEWRGDICETAVDEFMRTIKDLKQKYNYHN